MICNYILYRRPICIGAEVNECRSGNFLFSFQCISSRRRYKGRAVLTEAALITTSHGSVFCEYCLVPYSLMELYFVSTLSSTLQWICLY